MTTKLTPFSERTAENIYLEWVNDWLTVDAMADNYGRKPEELIVILNKGREEHNKQHYIYNKKHTQK